MADTDTATAARAAQAATERGALDLGQVTVIGIAGAPDARRALIRHPSGRVRTVEAGDRVGRRKILRIEAEGLVVETGGKPALMPLATAG